MSGSGASTGSWAGRDAVRVAGPDAASFLQGQLSQDIDRIEVGGSAWSFVLQPQGKVDALLRVRRTGADEFLLDTDEGWGERVAARLNRFKLRTKVEIAVVPDAEVPEPVADGWPVFAAGADGERARIEAGFPKMGAEADESTIPAELGRAVIEHAVSFTKGCYTGQELVARVDSRGGNVPRHLRRLRIDGVVPPVGATLHAIAADGDRADSDRADGDKEVGRLTSVEPVGDGAVALGFVARAVEVPADLEVRWAEGRAPARAEPLSD